MGKYIGDLKIITGKNEKAPSGFTRIDTDLNDGAKGDYIYLCYKETDNKSEAITRIFFLHGKDAPKPDEYDVKLDQDLNDGAGGEFIYLCYRRRPEEDPITDLEVISGKKNTIAPPLDGYIRINDDLNAGAGGLFIYLCYKPAMEVKENDDRFSHKVNDVISNFNEMNPEGKNETFKNLPYFSNLGWEHIQGYTQYEDENGKYYYLFTHHTTGDYGYILLSGGADGKNVKKIKLEDGWSHPGGIQAIGQYLFIPCEKDERCKIFVYDIKTMNFIKDFEFNHMAGCLGITDFNHNDKSYYLLLIGDQYKYFGYTAEVTDNMKDLKFKSVGTINLENKGYDGKNMNCQGIGLVTDTNGSLYMIALMSHGNSNYEDWAYLIKITIDNDKIGYNKIDQRQFKSKGGISGVDGTHFRWGAGIRINPSGKLILLATSRNIIAGTKLDTNYWR